MISIIRRKYGCHVNNPWFTITQTCCTYEWPTLQDMCMVVLPKPSCCSKNCLVNSVLIFSLELHLYQHSSSWVQWGQILWTSWEKVFTWNSIKDIFQYSNISICPDFYQSWTLAYLTKVGKYRILSKYGRYESACYWKSTPILMMKFIQFFATFPDQNDQIFITQN